MQKAQKFLRQFIITLPLWMIFIAVALYWHGYSAEVKSQNLCYAVASALLSGGVFAATLKSIQFMGVFEEILTRIVLLKPEWLRSLSADQLSKLWGDVMTTAVSKGFPGLSERMRRDVFHNIIPKMGEFYYSEMTREISFSSYDRDADILVMDELYQLCINAHSTATGFPYKFSLVGDATLKNNENPFVISELKINNKDYLKEIKSSLEGGVATLDYDIQLSGSEKYTVLRKMTRTVKVSRDPVLNMIATRFTDGMIVRVINNISDLQVEAIGTGVDQNQVKKHHTVVSELMHTWEIEQLLFPGDGLTIVIKRV